MKHNLTCIECPIGCSIEVEVENGKAVSVVGNGCPRGKTYSENEVVCSKRVLTTTVRTRGGSMLSVKTSAPVKKSETFEIMKKINAVRLTAPVRIGDVLVKEIAEDVDLIATGNSEGV